ncbi:PhyH-domain-containing protein [Martensiomyces pterosporus]|nr:PhyH-domain-containing protein [Martensiomyces pterosporus]
MVYEYALSQEQIDSYHRDGFLKVTDLLSLEETDKLIAEVRKVQSWPDTPGKWMNYYELNTKTNTTQLCRTENFTPYSDYIREIVAGERTMAILKQLTGEPYVLFKEKINAKLPGGQGFKPHQDAPAFTHLGQVNHITILFTIDGSYLENGCLRVVPGSHIGNKIIPHHDDGTIVDEWYNAHEWVPVECNSGDILIFGSYLAHVSFENKSDDSRANLYMTYNPLREGDKREEYYADKRKKFPPLNEREPGKDYSEGARTYNYANPIL